MKRGMIDLHAYITPDLNSVSFMLDGKEYMIAVDDGKGLDYMIHHVKEEVSKAEAIPDNVYDFAAYKRMKQGA